MIQKKKQSKHGIGGLKMQENKMEQVANLFDKTLGEEFTVEDKYKAKWHCKFTKNGVIYQDRISFNWQFVGGMLQLLATGKAVIINE